MRPLLIAVLVAVTGGVFAAAGAAHSTAPGDGCLVVSGGYGKMTITLTRGVVFGRFSEGYLVYSDQDGDSTTNLPRVPDVIPTKIGNHVWKYGPANDVRFRTTGSTKITVYATQINLSVAGKGVATLSLSGFLPDIPGNRFSVDDESFCADNFQKMPLTPTKFQISSPVTG